MNIAEFVVCIRDDDGIYGNVSMEGWYSCSYGVCTREKGMIGSFCKY